MFKSQALILGMISMGLVMGGCGKNLPPLNTDQKTTVQNTLDDMGRSYSAPQNIHNGVAAFQTDARSINAAPTTTAPFNSGTVNKDSSLTSMQQEIQSKHCSFSSDSSAQAASSQAPVQVTGPDCPIAMDFQMSLANQTNTGATINFKWDYDVNSATYKAYNDVDSIHLSGSINAQANSSGSNADGKITGTVHSQKIGAITLNLTITESTSLSSSTSSSTSTLTSSSGQTEIDLVYPTFEADLKTVIKNGTTQYFLNSEAITAAQFQAYVQNMGAALPTSGSSNTGGAPAQITSGTVAGMSGKY